MSKKKLILFFIILLFVSLPLAVVVTVTISPFWNWFETVTDIESYGHMGPATWCYLFIYSVISIISIYALCRRYKSAKDSTKTI